MQGVRRARDPIEHVRTLILEHELAEPGDLKRMEKEIKKVLHHGCVLACLELFHRILDSYMSSIGAGPL